MGLGSSTRRGGVEKFVPTRESSFRLYPQDPWRVQQVCARKRSSCSFAAPKDWARAQGCCKRVMLGRAASGPFSEHTLHPLSRGLRNRFLSIFLNGSKKWGSRFLMTHISPTSHPRTYLLTTSGPISRH